MNIADHIPIGRENAIHLKKLSDRIGKSDMVVKQLVRNARRSGIPIMSDKEGYWIASREKRVCRQIKRTRSCKT